MEKLFKEAATQFMENMLHAVTEAEKEEVDTEADREEVDTDEAINEQATKLMLKLKNTRADKTKAEAIAELLEFAKKNPTWIYELFLFNKNDQRTILHAFAEKKADLASIQALCGLAHDADMPKLVAIKSQQGEYPLHSAIRSGAPPDVLKFLIDQEPNILSIPSKTKLPIELAVDYAGNNKQYGGLRVILAKLSSSSEGHEIQFASLRKAFDSSFPLDILKQMVALPNREPIKEWKIYRRMTFEEIKVFCMLLPQLESLECALQTPWESPDAFLYFMGGLQNNRKLSNLRLLTLPSLEDLDKAKQKEMTAALTDLLFQDNSQLDTVSVDFMVHDTYKSIKLWFDAIFPNNPNKKSSIHHFVVLSHFRTRFPELFEETKQACLEMLESNTSLITCEPWAHHDNEIRHMLDFNRYGRGKARCATASEMVKMLLSLAAEDFRPLEQTSLSYLLLKQNPGVWSQDKLTVAPVEVENETGPTNEREPENETAHDEAQEETPQRQMQSSKGKRKPTSGKGKRKGKQQKCGSS